MYHQVASKLALTTDYQYSQALSMQGANGALIEITVISAGTADYMLKYSNDLQNWTDYDTTDYTLAGPGYETEPLTGISAGYVRLQYKARSGTVIVAAGVNTANL